MKRVVITGLGIVSSIGNNAEEVLTSLKAGKSGISYSDSFAEQGLKSNVWGKPELDIKEHIDRKALRFMGDAAGYAYIAMGEAISDAKLTDEHVSNVRTGIIAGSGGASSAHIVASTDTLRERGIRRVVTYAVPKTMGSTVSACLATPFKIKGVN
jgi:3-oxoacyl-[acyl-carrier-protein] synthase-1